MSERAVAYPAPTVAVVPVRIGPLEDQLALRFGQILAQPFVLQEKRAQRMSQGIPKGQKKLFHHTHKARAHGYVDQDEHGAGHQGG